MAEMVIKESGLLTEMYADRTPENLSKQENMQELLNGIHGFCESRLEEGEEQPGLVDFLAEVSLATDQDTQGDENNEKVTLMTVHAAKGLEFNNVFVVGMEKDLFPSMWANESETSLEEERRLFYVAITRAGKQCTLTYAKSRFRNGKSEICSPSRFLNDIDPKFLNMPTDNRLAEEVRERAAGFNRTAFGRKDSQVPQRPQPEIFSKTRPDSTKHLTPVDKLPVAPFTGAQTNTDVRAGQHILHDRFGNGVVSACEGDGDNRKITVLFEHAGERKLLLKYAKFVITD
jgi:DNA helicase-2/ATP-dependent DNA helicase PcrA